MAFTAVIGYLLCLWMLGLIYLLLGKRHKHEEAKKALILKFNQSSLSILIELLKLGYTPVTETTLITFSCRRINGVWMLREEPNTLCQGPEYDYWCVFVLPIRRVFPASRAPAGMPGPGGLWWCTSSACRYSSSPSSGITECRGWLPT